MKQLSVPLIEGVGTLPAATKISASAASCPVANVYSIQDVRERTQEAERIPSLLHQECRDISRVGLDADRALMNALKRLC